MRAGLRLAFVGEKRSPTAIRMGVTWEDGRLCADTLLAAVRASGLAIERIWFTNLWCDDGSWHGGVAAELRDRARAGWVVIGLGRKVQRALAGLGIACVPMVHPAARGAIRKTERYRAHVAEILGGL